MWILFFMASALSLPTIPGLQNLLSSPEEKKYVQSCQRTLDKLKQLEEKVGEISQKNVHAYSSAHLNLSYVIGDCANIQSSHGSELQKKQTDAVVQLYTVFIKKQLLTDLHGNGSSFDPTAQNLFTKEPPLDPAHFLCKPEKIDIVDSFIERSWLTSELKKLEQKVRGTTPMVDFENQLASEYAGFVAIAKEKANQCLESKLDQVRAYSNAAPSSIQKEWDSTIRKAVADHIHVDIARIVYPHAQFKRFRENKREILSDGTIRENKMDYDAMDVFVYVVNGTFVDGYIVTLYKDHIQNSSYARFYGLDANGNLRASQRLLQSNF
jgi:hypothetical protein